MTVRFEKTCDGPFCGCLILDSSTNYRVVENKQIAMHPGDNGPWDFCSFDCLSSWAVQR